MFPNIYERPIGPRTGIGYPEADVVEIRFIVPTRISGSIIGKKGDYVAKLRKDFQVGVGIPNAPNNKLERICVIRGGSVRNVIDCTCAISDYPLKKEMIRALGLQPHQTHLRLLMHHSICGVIIGKKGAKVQEIKNMAGADVIVSNHTCPESSDKVVKITGSVTELRDALALIFKYTGDVETIGDEKNYDGSLPEEGFHIIPPDNYLGWTEEECANIGLDDATKKQQRAKPTEQQIENKNSSDVTPKVELDRYGKPRWDNLTEKAKFKFGGKPPNQQAAAKFGNKKDYFDSSNWTGQQYQGENSAKLKDFLGV